MTRSQLMGKRGPKPKEVTYDPATGKLFKAGKEITTETGTGYLSIWFMGRSRGQHRVAWFLSHGEWPECIDHINGNGRDNRLVNLRASDYRLNRHNQTGHRKSHTGVLGVYPNGSGFQASIGDRGQRYRLGTYPTKELAAAAYAEAKQRLHEHGQIRM